jgi:4-hydroxymandelate oxidase
MTDERDFFMQPVNLNEFEAIARDKLPKMAFGYYASGSDDEVTLGDNRVAFDCIKLLPHYMVGTDGLDTGTIVNGMRLDYPIMIAPMAFMAMAHPDGELAMARAAAHHGTPMILSTMSTYKIEDVATAADGVKWFQLYVYKDRDVTRALVERAEKAGYSAIALTIDVPVLGRREVDIHNSFHLPPHLSAANLMGEEMREVRRNADDSSLAVYINELWEDNLQWQDLEWLASITDLPIYVKGILRPDDARTALDHGAGGIIVSNHGGRQLDTAPATIDVIGDIAEAVGDQTDILMDGGIRRGTDIIKAIALGAKAVLIGRPMMYSLAYDGEAGANHALDLIQEEFKTAMILCGCRTLADITPDLLMR